MFPHGKVTAQVLLLSANCGACPSLCGITLNYNTSPVRRCVSVRLRYCLMPETNLWIYNVQTPGNKESVKKKNTKENKQMRKNKPGENEKRRRSNLRCFLPQEDHFMMIIIPTLLEVFHASGFHLELCHRANSVIMGKPFSNLSSQSRSPPSSPSLFWMSPLLSFPITV